MFILNCLYTLYVSYMGHEKIYCNLVYLGNNISNITKVFKGVLTEFSLPIVD